MCVCIFPFLLQGYLWHLRLIHKRLTGLIVDKFIQNAQRCHVRYIFSFLLFSWIQLVETRWHGMRCFSVDEFKKHKSWNYRMIHENYDFHCRCFKVFIRTWRITSLLSLVSLGWTLLSNYIVVTEKLTITYLVEVYLSLSQEMKRINAIGMMEKQILWGIFLYCTGHWKQWFAFWCICVYRPQKPVLTKTRVDQVPFRSHKSYKFMLKCFVRFSFYFLSLRSGWWFKDFKVLFFLLILTVRSWTDLE